MENHETQEPQETKETQKTTSEGSQKKEKNPKRVAAGKKGAKVRWSKQMQDVKSSPVPAEQGGQQQGQQCQQ